MPWGPPKPKGCICVVYTSIGTYYDTLPMPMPVPMLVPVAVGNAKESHKNFNVGPDSPKG